MKLKHYLLICLCLLSGIKAFAYDAKINGIYYNFSGDEAIVTYQKFESSKISSDYSGAVSIPSSVTYNGKTYRVTAVGWAAFKNSDNVTSITVPSSVTHVGDDAFFGCKNLTTVTLPNSTTSIPRWAFCNSGKLTNFVIPNSVTSIGDYAFSSCSSLTSISIPNGVTSIGERVFQSCSALSSISIPSSVESIGCYALDGTAWLNNQPNGLVYAGNVAYQYKGTMSSGTSITLKSGTLGIAGYAFNGCTGLTYISIPNSVTNVGEEAFKGTTWFNNQPNGMVYAGKVAYKYKGTMPSGTSITIKDGTLGISGNAFYDCSGLSSIVIPEGVRSIGYMAFYKCTSLTSVTIPNSVKSIGYKVFSYSGLTSATIGSGVTSVEEYAFEFCRALTSITIGKNVSNYGDLPFNGCSSLRSVTVERETPAIISDRIFLNPSYYTLYVPIGCKAAYASAINWKEFKVIKEVEPLISGICYSLNKNDKTATVISLPEGKYEGSINIPSSITYEGNTYSVTSIGEYAFYQCSGLTSIAIGGGVTSIGHNAFNGCTGLTSITIPNNVKSIDYNAFYGCTNLTSVTMGSGVTSVGNSAFYGCTSLTSVTFFCKEIGSWFYSMSSIKEVIIGNNVTSIGRSAFYGCTGLTSVNIPNNVTNIGSSAFSGCTGLTSVNIPNSVKSIDESAFYNCSGLASVNIPNSVTSIGGSAFRNCSSLTSVTIPNSVDSIRSQTFYGCSNLTSINIPNSVKHIGAEAFRGCSNLTFVLIPNSVTSIDSGAFQYCNKLTNVKVDRNTPLTIDENTFSYRKWATLYVPAESKAAYAAADYWKEFKYIKEIVPEAGGLCYSLNNTDKTAQVIASPYGNKYEGDIVIPSSVTFDGETYSVTSVSGFSDCSGLTSITFPNSVTSISGFSGCTGLTSVTFPNSVTSIDGFSGCTGLTSVTFPNSVTSISGFSGCTNLSSISIPNSVTSIDSGSFGETAWYNSQPDGMVYIGKVALNYKGTMPEGTHITIKEGTTVIARGALSGEFNPQCRENLTSVNLPNSLTHIGDWAFGYSSNLTSVNIPSSVISIGGMAFYRCSNLTSITIPTGVTSIGSIAFYGCSSLTSITIPASVTSFGGEIFGGCNFDFMILESETPFFESIQNWYSTITTTVPILYVPAGCKDAYIAAFSTYYDNYWKSYVWSIKDKLPELVDGIYYDFDTENKVAEVAYPFNGEKYEGNIVIPSSVTYKGVSYSVTGISPAAFYKCDSLISVTIPESVTSIGTHAFYNCTGLFSVIVEREMPVTIYIKEDYLYDVFSGCRNATLYVPVGSRNAYAASEGWNVFKSIIEGAPDMVAGLYYKFDKANKVAEVTCSPYGDKYKGSISIPSSVAYNGETYSVTRIDSLAFRGCTDLTSVVIPNGVTNIDQYSFRGCSSLTSINIPNSVTSIGNGAFSGCTSLTSIIIPNSVTSIGNYAFEDCTGMKSITIPESVTSIGYGAFWYCSSLSSITIPNSVTSIGPYAFEETAWLKKQPNGLVYAGKVAYKYKGTMPEGSQIVIKDGTLGIAGSAFSGCSGLTSVTIPSSVINIGNGAFEYCSGLTSVTIPGSVTNIGDRAFANCNNLTTVKVGMETPVPISWYTFSNRKNATLYVPVGCKADYAAADYWKEFKQIIEETPQIAGLYYRFDKSKMVAEVIASPHGDKYQGDIVIPDSVILRGGTYIVTSIADSAFSYCTSLKSVTIPRYMTYISKSAFYGSYSYYGYYNFKFYATANTDGLIAVWNYGVDPYKSGSYSEYIRPYITSSSLTQTSIKYRVGNVYGFEYETNGEDLGSYTHQITGLRPEYSQLITLTVRSANNSYSTSTTLTTLPVTPVVNIENLTASSFTAKGTCKFTGYIPDIISRKITVDSMEKDGDEMTFRGLDPNTSHTCKYKLVLEYPGRYRYTCEGSKEITTAELTLVTKQPKTISEGNVIVAAETNVDDEEANVGFEWRRIDWTDDFDSKSGGAYLFEGMMEGYIRSVNSNYLWKFRPFYTSNAGNTYYGEWKGMDPSDYSYFEPTVHTYADIDVTGNSAEVKGYAMRGTDNVTSQGFMYWENNTSYSLRRRVASIPDNVTVVKASGNVMTAKFEDLEYETSYSYVAFVTTSEGETFYGEVKTFSTGLDPVGIDDVKSQEAVTEVARYDVQGRRIDKPQKGMNIIHYSDGSTRKVMVK